MEPARSLTSRFARAKAVVTIDRLFAAMGLPPSEGGRGAKILCPFHGDTHASAVLYKQGTYFHCFTCGAHGDVLDLTQRMIGGAPVGALFFLESLFSLDKHDLPQVESRIQRRTDVTKAITALDDYGQAILKQLGRLSWGLQQEFFNIYDEHVGQVKYVAKHTDMAAEGADQGVRSLLLAARYEFHRWEQIAKSEQLKAQGAIEKRRG